MKKISILLLLVTLILVGNVEARSKNSFDRVMTSYEPIRLALADDSLKGVSRNAEKITKELQHLRRNITAGEAGVKMGDGMFVFANLQTVAF